VLMMCFAMARTEVRRVVVVVVVVRRMAVRNAADMHVDDVIVMCVCVCVRTQRTARRKVKGWWGAYSAVARRGEAPWGATRRRRGTRMHRAWVYYCHDLGPGLV
jgi:hypothetical protein